jgi:diguanylate cyclase (GGDEF) domain
MNAETPAEADSQDPFSGDGPTFVFSRTATSGDKDHPLSETTKRLLRKAQRAAEIDPAQARLLSEEAERHAVADGSGVGIVRALRLQARLRTAAGEYPDALRLLHQALELARANEERTLEGRCLSDLAIVHDRLREPTLALEYNLRAREVQRAAGDADGLGVTLNNTGAVYYALGDYRSSLTYFLEALEVARDAGDLTSEGLSLHNIARIRTELGEAAEAMPYSHEALALARETERKPLQAAILHTLGRQHLALNQPEEAERAYARSLALAREIGDRQAEGDALTGLAETYDYMGRTAEALGHYWQALDLAKSNDYRHSQITVLHKVGLSYLASGDLTNARRCLNEVVRLCAPLKASRALYKALDSLSRLCEQAGDLAGALRHLRESHRVERELNNQQAHSQMAAVVIKLEVEKSQKEAEIERLRLVELADANAALRAADAEKSRLLDQLRAQAAELERQATEDALTGLFNRRHLEATLSDLYLRSRLAGTPLTVALADIDDFKAINDGFGHQVGDEVLRIVGGLLRQGVRPRDTAARYGGEEFAIALPGLSLAEALPLCEAIRLQVATYPWSRLANGLSVTISMGLSDDLRDPNHERLLSHADDLLYRAKHAGKNRVAAPKPLLRDPAPYRDDSAASATA